MNYHDELSRQRIKTKKKIVIKVGTSSLTYKNGKANLQFIDHLVSQIVDLKNRGSYSCIFRSNRNRFADTQI